MSLAGVLALHPSCNHSITEAILLLPPIDDASGFGWNTRMRNSLVPWADGASLYINADISRISNRNQFGPKVDALNQCEDKVT